MHCADSRYFLLREEAYAAIPEEKWVLDEAIDRWDGAYQAWSALAELVFKEEGYMPALFDREASTAALLAGAYA